jgi:Leucine-rich repeat (LRR) protein
LLPKLEHMRLKSWAVTDRGMQHLGRCLTSLRSIELDSCYGVGPEGIQALAPLGSLTSFTLKCSPPLRLDAFCSLTTLHSLSLTAEKWADQDALVVVSSETALTGLQKLTKLVFTGCKMQQQVLKDIGKHLTSLRDIRFHQCFPIINLQHLARLDHLIRLELDGSRVFDLESLQQSTSLQTLFLPRCELPGGDLSHILQLHTLRVLDLSENWNIRDERASWVLSNFSHLTRLEELYLKQVANEPVVAHLPALTALRVLDLRGSAIGERGMSHLGKIHSLVDLRIGKVTPLRDDGLGQLTDLRNLVSLNLSGAGDVTLEGLQHLLALPHLKRLHLESCKRLNTGDMRKVHRVLPAVNISY